MKPSSSHTFLAEEDFLRERNRMFSEFVDKIKFYRLFDRILTAYKSSDKSLSKLSTTKFTGNLKD